MIKELTAAIEQIEKALEDTYHGNWDDDQDQIFRQAAKAHLALLKKIEAGEVAIVPVEMTMEMAHDLTNEWNSTGGRTIVDNYTAMLKAIDQQQMIKDLSDG